MCEFKLVFFIGAFCAFHTCLLAQDEAVAARHSGKRTMERPSETTRNVNITKVKVALKSDGLTRENIPLGDPCYILPGFDAKLQVVDCAIRTESTMIPLGHGINFPLSTGSYLECNSTYVYKTKTRTQVVYFDHLGKVAHQLETDSFGTLALDRKASVRVNLDRIPGKSDLEAAREHLDGAKEKLIKYLQAYWDAFIKTRTPFACQD